jgi:hypothetical protein
LLLLENFKNTTKREYPSIAPWTTSLHLKVTNRMACIMLVCCILDTANFVKLVLFQKMLYKFNKTITFFVIYIITCWFFLLGCKNSVQNFLEIHAGYNQFFSKCHATV